MSEGLISAIEPFWHRHTINYIKRTLLLAFNRAYYHGYVISPTSPGRLLEVISTPGSFSLHSLSKAFCDRHGSSVTLLVTHTCHSTSHITFFLNTITNHYHFIQCFGILLQDYLNGRLSFHLRYLRSCTPRNLLGSFHYQEHSEV